MPMKFLAGPTGDPFRMRDSRSTETKKIGDGFRMTWERKVLPDSVGAGRYAYETYGLPPYARFGFGNINVQNPNRATSPASYVFQSVGIVGLPPAGQLQGQFVTQPLMDPSEAQRVGLILPGAVAPAPNAIYKGSPILAP